MTNYALRFENLTVTHHRHPVVHHLTAEIPRGSLTAVVGPNGAGKSSLLDVVVGRTLATTGSIQIAPDLLGNVGYLPQQPGIDRGFPVRVLDVIQLGAWRQLGTFRGANPQTRERALEALATVGLSNFEHRLLGELSVGQFQRVLFARLLLQDARLILLDEPFNALDARTCEDLLALVAHWREEGRTVVAVLHDLPQVRDHFDQTLLLARECIAWGPTQSVLTSEHLQRARQVSTHWDDKAAECHRPAPPSTLPALDP